MKQSLKSLLQDGKCHLTPGVYDALLAKICEQIGFKVLVMGGYGVAASILGEPDVGYLSMTEMATRLGHICDVVDVPVIADGDTGYGNPLSVQRTVREFEKAGAAAIFLEDQEWPKRCGHMAGKRVISMEEHVQKIRAAVDARQNPEFLIMSRTDARAVNGLDDAIERSLAYKEAGADIIFVEAPQSVDELKEISARLKGVPLVANMIEHGRTPILNPEELAELGYSIAFWPCTAPYLVAKAAFTVFGELYEKGTTEGVMDHLIPFPEFNTLVGLDYYRELERRYGTGSCK